MMQWPLRFSLAGSFFSLQMFEQATFKIFVLLWTKCSAFFFWRDDVGKKTGNLQNICYAKYIFVPKAKLDVHDIVLQDIAVTQLKTNNIVAPMYAAGFKGCSRRGVLRS